MEFSIESATSDQKLTFSNRKGGFFEALLSGVVTAHIKVSTYTDEYGLRNLFQKMGDAAKPWQEELTWEALEGEFTLSATCSNLGQVQFRISFWGLPGHPEEWRISTGLASEFGQLQNLANQAKRFFG